MFTRESTAIVVLAVVAAIGGGWLQHQSRLAHVPAGVQVAEIGEIRPDLTLQDLDGHARKLSEFRGHRVLINFWASWCVPCLGEMPILSKAQVKFGENGAIVLGIAMDDPARVRQFLASRPVNYPVLLGQLASPSTSMLLGDTDQVLPYSVLIGADGHMLAAQRGALSEAIIAEWLTPPSAP